jgi:hypothetical protein
MQIDTDTVPTGEKIAGDVPDGRKFVVRSNFLVGDRNIPRNANGKCTSQLENKTGETRLNIEKLTGLNENAFRKLLNLL